MRPPLVWRASLCAKPAVGEGQWRLCARGCGYDAAEGGPPPVHSRVQLHALGGGAAQAGTSSDGCRGVEAYPDASPGRIAFSPGLAKDLAKALHGPPARLVPAGLGVPHGSWVHPGLPSQFLLRQPEPEPGGPDLAREPVAFGNEPGAEYLLDRRPAAGQGLTPVPFPGRDRLGPATQPLRQGSLRQPEVHPAPADPLPEGPGLVRITPWEHSRFRPAEPQAGKWQRNGEGSAPRPCEGPRPFSRLAAPGTPARRPSITRRRPSARPPADDPDAGSPRVAKPGPYPASFAASRTRCVPITFRWIWFVPS